MKFRSLAFRRFGAFDERILDLSANGRNLHVVYGANEAGKSTALAGLGYFLFGFPTRVTHAFRYGANEQRVAATLVDKEGKTFEAVRRRANKNGLRAADDKTPLADDCLKPLLGGLDKAQFAMLFGLNHAQLVAGGETIVTGQGSVGQMLFAAGAGLAGLRRIERNLDERLDALYKKAGQKQVIPAALTQLKAERDRLREQTIAIDAWLAQKEQLEKAVAETKTLEDERVALKQEEKRLLGYRAAFPTIAALDGFVQQVQSLANAPRLPAEFGDVYRATLEDLKSAEAQRDRHRDDAAKAETALANSVPEPQVLAEVDAILQIKEDLGAILKADRDRDPLYARMREHQGEARNTLRACFKKEALEEAESLRVSQAEQDRIRTLGEARAGLMQAVAAHEFRLKQLDAQIADLKSDLDESSAPLDVARLEALDRELLQEGRLEDALNKQIDEFRQGRAFAQRDLAKLEPYWKGSLKTLATIKPPSLDRVVVFEGKFAQHDADVREAETRRDHFAKVIRERTRQFDLLEQSGHVPTEEDLAAVRQQRDRIIDDYLTSEPNETLADAARASVRRGDDTCDRMRREATRVLDVARNRADLREAEEEHAIAVADLAYRQDKRATLQEQWLADWQSAEVTPGEPAEMRGWLAQWTAQCERREKLDQFARAITKLEEAVAKHKATLRAALNLGEQEKDATLTQLHAKAKRIIDAAHSVRTARIEHENRSRDREATVVQLDDARRKFAEWRAEWSRAVAAIGLDGDAEPATANRYLGDLTEIFRNLREAGTIELRLKGIDRDRGQFVSRLDALRQRLDGDRATPINPQDLDAAVDELMSRANDAKLRQGQHAKIEADLASARAKLASAEQDLVKNRARLQNLAEQAGFAAIDELPALILQSDRRRDLETRLAEERTKLRHHAGEQELDEFVAAANAARASLESRLTEVQKRQEVVEAEIPQRAGAAALAKQQLNEWQQTSSEAAERQQTIESLLAHLREQITEYAAVHLARQTLRLTIDRFRERRHDSLLAQAERYFGILTCGAYRGLDVESDDNGEPVLKAVRATPDEHVDVSALSEGTRDQLFLALRLAAIEQHVAAHGPMPVIVDDILVNFDDTRASATFACLAEISKLTQILVFTHHSHVLELAKSVAPDAVCCHDLSAGANGETE